jgi:hypothetical protein
MYATNDCTGHGRRQMKFKSMRCARHVADWPANGPVGGDAFPARCPRTGTFARDTPALCEAFAHALKPSGHFMVKSAKGRKYTLVTGVTI